MLPKLDGIDTALGTSCLTQAWLQELACEFDIESTVHGGRMVADADAP